MREPHRQAGIFDRMERGEISRVEAYEASLEHIKDSLFSRLLSSKPSRREPLDRIDAMDPITTAETEESSSQNPEAVYHLMELIGGIRTAMLSTIDNEGAIRSRPMLTQKGEDDGLLYFFSSDHHGIADDLSIDPRVNVTYAMPDKKQFISISGLAELMHDEGKARELWDPSLKSWFPEGVEDRHLALLKVYIQKAEYWDVPSNRILDILKFTKAVLTGGTFHTAEPHQKIRFEAGLSLSL